MTNPFPFLYILCRMISWAPALPRFPGDNQPRPLKSKLARGWERVRGEQEVETYLLQVVHSWWQQDSHERRHGTRGNFSGWLPISSSVHPGQDESVTVAGFFRASSKRAGETTVVQLQVCLDSFFALSRLLLIRRRSAFEGEGRT